MPTGTSASRISPGFRGEPEPRERGAHLGDGGPRAHAAGGRGAGAGRHLAGARRRAFPPAVVRRGAARARSSSRWAPTCRTTTPTRAGAPTPRTGSGPVRVTAGGLVPPSQVLMATYVTFGLAVACGVYLVAVAGPELLAVGAASILAGVLYTGGPRPYGYEGLGELFVFLFFGIVAVVGSYFVQVQTLPVAGLRVRGAGGPAGERDPGGEQRARPGDRPARGQAHARGSHGPGAHAHAVHGDGGGRVRDRAAVVGARVDDGVAAAPLGRHPAGVGVARTFARAPTDRR